MSTISSDGRTIEHSPGEKAALLRLSYHVISDQVSGFGSHEARMILHLLARYSRSIRSHPIEDGEGVFPTLEEAHRAAVSAAQTFYDAASVEETNWTGWGDQIVPFSAEMRRVKAEQALNAIRDADPSNPGTSKVENSRST